MNYSNLELRVQQFKAEVARTRALLARETGRFIVIREVELIPYNSAGRVADPDYFDLKDLADTRAVGKAVATLLNDNPDADGVSLEVGFDAYVSKRAFDEGWDYDPRIWHVEVELERAELAGI